MPEFQYENVCWECGSFYDEWFDPNDDGKYLCQDCRADEILAKARKQLDPNQQPKEK